MDVLITLTNVGTDQGTLFDLYSDVDLFSTPFDTDVTLASLTTGYTASVPDLATIVRVCGQVATCTNCLDLNLTYTTTTTTTISSLWCNAVTGGEGYTDYEVLLGREDGLLVLDMNAYGVPDKVEIIWNGTKVATTGMTVPNAGPFDDTTEPPSLPSVLTTYGIDQYIGTAKGIVPTREAEILADTGQTYIASMQLLWFEYTQEMAIEYPTAIVRVTGPATTTWELTRLCGENTTTTTTTTEVPTTTTTTTATPTTTTTTTLTGLEELVISSGSNITAAGACSVEATVDTVYADTATPGTITAEDRVYEDSAGTIPFVGDGNYYKFEFVSNPGVYYASRITFTGKFLDSQIDC